MNPRRLRFAVPFALLLAACSTRGGFSSDKVLTAEDAGLVLLRSDERFSVKLDSSPGTGFDWHVLISNESLLIREGEPVFALNQNRPTARGVGGTETFSYRVVGGGETQLRFEYKRSLESEQPAQVVVFDLVVN